jgi:signal transduction histidine kinase
LTEPAGSTGAGERTWRRKELTDYDWYYQLPRWEAYFAVIAGFGLVLAWTTTTNRTDQLVASGLLVGLIGWWIAFGRRMYTLHRQSLGHGLTYVLGALALLVPLLVVNQQCSWVLFSITPQIFMVLESDLISSFAVSVCCLLPALVAFLTGGVNSEFWSELTIGIGVAGISLLINSATERIARQSAERAKLIAELQASRAQVVDLSREAGVAAERERLAGEIHDTLAQGFTSILTLVQAAAGELARSPDRTRAHLDLAARTARENLSEARALVGALTPAALGSGSLADAIGRQAARLTEEAGVETEFDTDFDTDGEPGALPTAAEVVLLRTAQEALTNVRKHARARSVRITLGAEQGRVWLTVADDGMGFDPATPSEGFGLRGMRNRVEQVGGTLTVDSGPTGTTVRVEVGR